MVQFPPWYSKKKFVEIATQVVDVVSMQLDALVEHLQGISPPSDWSSEKPTGSVMHTKSG